jgi:hypothetical protein
LLHVGFYCESLEGKVLLKWSKEMEVTRLEIGTVRRVIHHLLAVVP